MGGRGSSTGGGGATGAGTGSGVGGAGVGGVGVGIDSNGRDLSISDLLERGRQLRGAGGGTVKMARQALFPLSDV